MHLWANWRESYKTSLLLQLKEKSRFTYFHKVILCVIWRLNTRGQKKDRCKFRANVMEIFCYLLISSASPLCMAAPSLRFQTCNWKTWQCQQISLLRKFIFNCKVIWCKCLLAFNFEAILSKLKFCEQIEQNLENYHLHYFCTFLLYQPVIFSVPFYKPICSVSFILKSICSTLSNPLNS